MDPKTASASELLPYSLRVLFHVSRPRTTDLDESRKWQECATRKDDQPVSE
jgi:hypothetical protein